MTLDARGTVAEVIGMWNGAAKDRLEQLLAPGYRGHMLGVPGGEREAAGYAGAIDRFRTGNPGVMFRIVEQFDSGVRWVTRLEARRPNAGSRTWSTSQGINIARLDDEGRLAEEWAIWSAWSDVESQGSRTG